MYYVFGITKYSISRAYPGGALGASPPPPPGSLKGLQKGKGRERREKRKRSERNGKGKRKQGGQNREKIER